MGTIITGVLLVVLIALAAATVWKQRKRGNSCSGCARRGECRFYHEKDSCKNKNKKA